MYNKLEVLHLQCLIITDFSCLCRCGNNYFCSHSLLINLLGSSSLALRYWEVAESSVNTPDKALQPSPLLLWVLGLAPCLCVTHSLFQDPKLSGQICLAGVLYCTTASKPIVSFPSGGKNKFQLKFKLKNFPWRPSSWAETWSLELSMAILLIATLGAANQRVGGSASIPVPVTVAGSQ